MSGASAASHLRRARCWQCGWPTWRKKEVLLLDPPPGFFDIEHFRGYPAVLLELEVVSRRNLKAAIAEAWRVCAPARFSLPAPGRPPAR